MLREKITQKKRVSRMRDLLGHAADNDYSDVEVLGAFIDYFNEHDVARSRLIKFYESLDFPEHGIEFGDGTFDDIVERYDELGGIPRSQILPDDRPLTPRHSLDVPVAAAYHAVAKTTSILLQPGLNLSKPLN